MSNSMITLYDIASCKEESYGWNAMGIKARLSLNFKEVQYRIVWLEYPELDSTMQRIGAGYERTKADGTPIYTMPVLVDPSHVAADGTPIPISDSWKIAEYLDKTYPGPGLLFPKGTRALQCLFLDYITRNILFTIGPLLIYPVMDVLSHESHEYWRLSQEAVFGVELEEICPKGSERWENTLVKLQKGATYLNVTIPNKVSQRPIVSTAFSELSTFLDKNGADGPFVLGPEVTFADFILVSKLETMAKIIPETWENRIQHWDNSRWQKMRIACAPWIQ
ncbi:hypothetical protein BU17DRAFT_98987 [Hysterangium stoloniferum]|nr:hypothetical protein BU17DRAFT_98987 [Hysterangium stoloniferum]